MKHVSLFCNQGSAAIKDVLMGQLHWQRQQWFQDWQAVKIDTRVMVSTQRLLASNERFVKHFMNMSNLEDSTFEKNLWSWVSIVYPMSQKITADFPIFRFCSFFGSMEPWRKPRVSGGFFSIRCTAVVPVVPVPRCHGGLQLRTRDGMNRCWICFNMHLQMRNFQYFQARQNQKPNPAFWRKHNFLSWVFRVVIYKALLKVEICCSPSLCLWQTSFTSRPVAVQRLFKRVKSLNTFSLWLRVLHPLLVPPMESMEMKYLWRMFGWCILKQLNQVISFVSCFNSVVAEPYVGICKIAIHWRSGHLVLEVVALFIWDSQGCTCQLKKNQRNHWICLQSLR